MTDVVAGLVEREANGAGEAGAERPWALERGATVLGGGRVRFSVWAPAVRAMAVRLVGGEWREPREPREHAMTRDEAGVFEVTLDGVAPGANYQFRLDGERLRPDPVSRFQPEGVHGPSRVVDPGAFRWRDDGWAGRAMADYVIYELHVGTFTPEGTFDAASRHLAELRDLGVTAIEIMPVAQFPGARNWGYDGVLPYAVQNTYGGPEALKRLVDAAHAAGLCVVMDVVYNHLGPEGNYLGEFGPYFTDVYKTPWGSPLNYDQRGSDEVRRYFIDNALYWVTEYHVDGLRLDAIHGIYDFGARHVLSELADAVHAQAARLGRTVVVIGESDLNDPRVVRPKERGGYGLDAQWSDDFHHAVHATLTGERRGYYADFSGGAAMIATALRDRFVYAGAHSGYRGRQHGAPATDVSADHFVVCVQNHDQVGNRAAGERLSALVSFEQLKLAASLLLLSPYVPLLFMGEEYGETNPFQYFVSHTDPALAEAVRQGRRKEFESFGWGEDVPDPTAPETFERSKLDRGEMRRSEHAALLRLYRELLRLRRAEAALRPGDADVDVAHGDGWITVRLAPRPPAGGARGAPPEPDDTRAGGGDRHRTSATGGEAPHGGRPGSALLVVFNVSDAPLVVPLPAAHRFRRWSPVLATDAPAYSPDGTAGERDPSGAAELTVPAWTAFLFRDAEDH